MANIAPTPHLGAAQADYLERKAADPTAFLTRRPDFTRDGFDLDTGKVAETSIRMHFGEWQPSELDDQDGDIAILRAIHTRAQTRWRDMIETLQAVRSDDDPSLNADGRLKVAARMLAPKVAEIEGLHQRETERIRGEVEREDAEIAKAMKQADPSDLALHADIRKRVHDMGDKRDLFVRKAIERGDLLSLQAVATAPAWMSGLDMGDDGAVEAYHLAREAVARAMAPDRYARATALRNGLLLADRGVKEYTRRARALINFPRANALIEREAQRQAGRT